MESEWDFNVFADAPVEIIDGDRGKNYPKQSEFSGLGKCLFLNTGNVTTQGFNFTACQFISAEKDQALRKGKLSRQDLIMTTRGTVGNVAYYSENVSFDHIRINSGMVIFRPDICKILPRFLYQFLRSSLFKTQVAALQTGSAQPQLPIRDISRIEVPIPPLKEQKAIGHILGTLDDKIELNRGMNETLEATARAIFKSWFVDFDPVRAKLNGQKPPAMDEKTAALFPDEFEESELGKIPKGWPICSLDSLGKITTGKTPSTKVDRNYGGKVPFLTPSDMDSRAVISTTKRYLTDQGVEIVRSAKVPTGAISVSCIGSDMGKVVMTGQDCVTNQQINSIVVNEQVHREYLFFNLRGRKDEIRNLGSGGSAVPILNKGAFSRVTVLLPPQSILGAYHRLAQPMVSLISANIQEIESLAGTRDTLLPKLLSGELPVPDAEKTIKEAV